MLPRTNQWMNVVSPNLRIRLATLALLMLIAPNCTKSGGGGSPTAPSGPPSPGSAIVYTAVGASDVIGFGSSKPCLPFADCDGNGYVWVAARQLRTFGYTVNVFSLGIPTTVISRPFAELAVQYGRPVVSNMIDGELPFIDRTSTLVTVFAGANEISTITAALGGGAGGTNPTAFVDTQANSWANDFATLIGGIRSRAPQARIVVLNVPNVGALPSEARDSTAQKQAAQRAAVRMTSVVNGTAGITVVDVMCDARLYQAAALSSDGFHPNDTGYAILGAEVAQAVTSASYPAPKASCPQMTQF
jgi:lysophospholipase L1-like esterase